MALDSGEQSGADPRHGIDLGQGTKPTGGGPALDDRFGERDPDSWQPSDLLGGGPVEIDSFGAEGPGKLRDPGPLLCEGRNRPTGKEGKFAGGLGGVEYEAPDPVPDQGTDQQRADGKTFVGCHGPKLRPGLMGPVTKLPPDPALRTRLLDLFGLPNQRHHDVAHGLERFGRELVDGVVDRVPIGEGRPAPKLGDHIDGLDTLLLERNVVVGD